MIGLIVYVPGLIWGAICSGAMARAQADASHGDAGVAAGTAFFSSGIGTGLGFIVFWGLPAGPIGWCVLGGVAILTALIAASAAKAQ